MQTVLLKCTGIWASFIPIAILNGLIREKCLAPLLGHRLALPLSGVFGTALFFLLTWFFHLCLGPLKLNLYWLHSHLVWAKPHKGIFETFPDGPHDHATLRHRLKNYANNTD